MRREALSRRQRARRRLFGVRERSGRALAPLVEPLLPSPRPIYLGHHMDNMRSRYGHVRVAWALRWAPHSSSTMCSRTATRFRARYLTRPETLTYEG